MQAQGMALLREATLPPEAHDEVQSWLHTSQQTVRPLCEKAGQDQASWLSHSCLSGVCAPVASHCSSSKAATQDLKYSPGLWGAEDFSFSRPWNQLGRWKRGEGRSLSHPH